MPATARTATQLNHITPVTLPASPGTAADTTNDDSFPNGGTTFLVMNNTAGSSGTVSVTPTTKVDDLAVTARTYTVPANTIQLVKLGPVKDYGNEVIVDASATTIKLAAYSV
jgi:hypothetical protein